MIETIRRHNTLITVCLLGLCVSALLYAKSTEKASDSGASKEGRRAILVRTSAAYQLYGYGRQALLSNKDAAAAGAFRASIKAEPQNPLAWVALADLRRRQGKSVEAILCYQMALGPHPDWNSLMVSYWDAAGQTDPEAALHYAQLCESMKLEKEATMGYTAVVAAVAHRGANGVQAIQQGTTSSPKQKAALAIALWRDHLKQSGEKIQSVPAMFPRSIH